MIARLQHWWQEMLSSFWFLPASIVGGMILLATGLIALDANFELHAERKWPLVFGAGAAGSRGLLTAVAGSMITVAGVVFSITIVALSLTSSQYTSRVLRNFMRDRINQVVLGVFVGIFAYCLVVLRVIRGGDEATFVPSFAVMGGLVLALVGIGFLIVFIHHISVSIQASSIIAAAATETIAAIDHLFPDELGDDTAIDAETSESLDKRAWFPIAACTTGYLESIDSDSLLAWAKKHDTTLRMERAIGEFVVEGAPLLSMSRPELPTEASIVELNEVYFISQQRTVQQDAGFGIRQIVDIALKALSPGVNDPTTAVICIDYLGAILAQLAGRHIATPHRLDEGTLRVIARGPSFESLLKESFTQIRQNGHSNCVILTRLLETLETIAKKTKSARRRQAIRDQAERITETAKCGIPAFHDRAPVERSFEQLSRVLNQS